MALNQLVNGFAAALYERDELMFVAIAEKFNLKLEDIRSAAHEVCDTHKSKAIKPQKRQAKRTGARGKKPRAPSAYQLFVNAHRDDAKRLLIESEEDRTFQNKDGEEVVVDSADFKLNGEPKFGQITQKVAAMWHALSDEDKAPYVKRAEEAKVAIVFDEDEDKVVIEDKNVSSSEEEGSDVEEVCVVSETKTPPRKQPPPRKGGRIKK